MIETCFSLVDKMANCILITTTSNSSSPTTTNTVQTINTSTAECKSEQIVLFETHSELTSESKANSIDVLTNVQREDNYKDNELSDNVLSKPRLTESNGGGVAIIESCKESIFSKYSDLLTVTKQTIDLSSRSNSKNQSFDTSITTSSIHSESASIDSKITTHSLDDAESPNSLSILKSTLIRPSTTLLEHLINQSHKNESTRQPINSGVHQLSSDQLDTDYLNRNRCCAEEKNRIRRELQKWSKNSLMFVGLQHVAQDLMGVELWRELAFTELNSDSVEQSNDEPIDWESDQVCSLCNSKTEFKNHCSPTIESQSNSTSIINSSIIQPPMTNHQFDQSTLSKLSSLLNLSTMTTNQIAMTNSNNLLNDTTLISNENMANQNVSDLSETVKIETNHPHSSEGQLIDYSSLLNNSNNCINSDLDNQSVKSETLSESATIDQNHTMTIGEDRNNIDTLVQLFKTDKTRLEQMFNRMNSSNTSVEQPLDLSLGSKKEFDFLSTLYANSEFVGKIKKTRLDSTKKRSYTEEELDKALNDIQSGKLGTRRAAALYKIPRSTLRNKVHKMNSGDKKLKSHHISPVNELLINDLDKEESKSTGNQFLTNNHDSLRELLKRNIGLSPKTIDHSSPLIVSNLASTSANLDHLQADLEIQQLLNLSQSLDSINNLNGSNDFSNISNFNNLNSLNNGLLMNSLTGNLNNNNILANLNNNNLNYLDSNLLNNDHNIINNNQLFNNTLTQLINLQSNNTPLSALDLIKLLNLIKTPEVNNNRLDIGDNLNESINSALSINSDRSSALKMMNDHFANPQNDEDTRSTLDDRSRRIILDNLEHCNDEHHHTDESNLTTPDEQIKKSQEFELGRQRSTNLNESMNSTSSLNNNILFSTLNLINNPLNPFNLANLSNGINNLSNLNNLTNLNNFQLNLQTMNDQNKSTKLPSANSGTDPQPAANTSTTNNTTDVDPNRKRPKRGRYRNYNKSDLDEAVKAVQRGEMSVHKAGTLFSIPHSTLEYKVKERHLLRPSKRLKKQQQQEAAAQANTLYPSTSTITNEPNNSGSSFSDNDMIKTGKLKNALIGKHPQEQSKFNNPLVDMSLIQKTLFQSNSNSNSIPNLHSQPNRLAASDLLKKLQENFKDDCFSNQPN